jgi:hypothetical protein
MKGTEAGSDAPVRTVARAKAIRAPAPQSRSRTAPKSPERVRRTSDRTSTPSRACRCHDVCRRFGPAHKNSQATGYSTSHNTNPSGSARGRVRRSRPRTAASRRLSDSRPASCSRRALTILRTIPQTNDGARTSVTTVWSVAVTRTDSSSRTHGIPAGIPRPNDRTSIGPRRQAAANLRRPTSTPVPVSKYRYVLRVAPRTRNDSGIGTAAVNRISGAIPLSIRRRGAPPSDEESDRALFRALTPRSVRLATSSRNPLGARPRRARPSRISPSTVRRPGCRAHPENGPPSYPKRTSQRVVTGGGRRRT